MILLAVALAVTHRVNDNDGLSITDRSSTVTMDIMMFCVCVCLFEWEVSKRAERRFVRQAAAGGRHGLFSGSVR